MPELVTRYFMPPRWRTEELFGVHREHATARVIPKQGPIGHSARSPVPAVHACSKSRSERPRSST